MPKPIGFSDFLYESPQFNANKTFSELNGKHQAATVLLTIAFGILLFYPGYVAFRALTHTFREIETEQAQSTKKAAGVGAQHFGRDQAAQTTPTKPTTTKPTTAPSHSPNLVKSLRSLVSAPKNLAAGDFRHTANKQVKYGKNANGDFYIEVKDRAKNPFHYDISADGKKGQKVNAHWNKGYPAGAEWKPLSDRDIEFLNWARQQIEYNEAVAVNSKATPAPLSTPVIQNLTCLIVANKNLATDDIRRTPDGKVKYGKNRAGNLYIEVNDRTGKPFHYDIFPDGKGGQKIHAHWNGGYPKSEQWQPITDDDLGLLDYAKKKIEQAETGAKAVAVDTRFDEGTRVEGEYIDLEVGEEFHPTYSWKEAYTNKKPGDWIKTRKTELPGMSEFARVATGAIYAYRGILSNFQKVSFVDPISKKPMKSGEHMFQSYKFPPGTTKRGDILDVNTPVEALTQARNTFPKDANASILWANVSLNLMVFVQLSKALEDETKLKQRLIDSKTDFIIEDTSQKAFEGIHPEKVWGDNGDGTGENQLGWAQMKAREIIQNAGGNLTEAMVKQYYEAEVKTALNAYYLQVFGYVPPK